VDQIKNHCSTGEVYAQIAAQSVHAAKLNHYTTA
jgi:hypothetical protein